MNDVLITERKIQRKSFFLSLVFFSAVVILLFIFKLSIQPKVDPPLFIQINFDVVNNPPVNLPKSKKVAPSKPQLTIQQTKSSASSSGGEKKEPSIVKSEISSASAAARETTPESKIVTQQLLNDNKNTAQTVVHSNDKTENPKQTIRQSLVNQTGERKSDNKGREALDHLLKGRQGTSQGSGWHGDGTIANHASGKSPNPNADGQEHIGSGGRKLIAWIPGTEGRGGERPSHNCSEVPGKFIKIAYTVNAEGRVISTSYHSGISDECIINTARKWVREYVRAETGIGNASGIYTIYF